MINLKRRHIIATGLGGAAIVGVAGTAALIRSASDTRPGTPSPAPREITWDDLLPEGVPYAEIVGEGVMDEANDYWLPVFDENARKLNADLDNALIRMPGYIIPLAFGPEGVSEFVLVPYVGACLHVPPPPPNQLVFVNSEVPWPSDSLWDAVWVTGTMQTQLNQTDVAETGYALAAVDMEVYQW